MRIRKNAKISSLLYTNANLSNAADNLKNLCQLNQSPWDIIASDSSPALHQLENYEVYYNVNVGGNGSWVDPIGAVESMASVKPSESKNYNLGDQTQDYGESLGFEEGEIEEEMKDEEGGKRICVTKNKKCQESMSMAGSRRRRESKKGGSTSSSPYDFYYYSGFGPSWGRKRGATGTSNTDMDIQKEMEKSVMSEVTYEDQEQELDGNKKITKSGIVGKKRGRKPIKARSLKSLM